MNTSVKTKDATFEELLLRGNRLSAAVEFLREYPQFERARLSRKIAEQEERTNAKLEQLTCDGDGVRIMHEHNRYCDLLQMAVDDKLFSVELAMQALNLYRDLPTPAVLTMVEQYVELLKTDY